MQHALKEPVLVLNANYEPLNVCTTRRAVGLMFSDKASLILNGRGYLRTVSTTFPCPSIIRLDRMIKRPRPKVKLNKQELFRRDKFTCQYCGRSDRKLTIDHVIPRRLGGKHTWNNLVAACPNCNHRKGGRTKEVAQMKLSVSPKAPNATAKYIFGRYLIKNQAWEHYVKGW